MDRMIRKQIYIEGRQEAKLKRVAKKRGLSEAEVIRQALDRELRAIGGPQPPRDPEAWQQALQFMRSLREKGPLPEQHRDWKREDLYEERLSRYDRHSR